VKGPHIVVLGGFGFDNLGDDLILSAGLRDLRGVLRTAKITILSNNPQETADRHPGEAVFFSPEALLRQLVLRPLIHLSRAHRRYLLPVSGRSIVGLLRSLKCGDLFVSFGGGYLNDYSKFVTHLRLLELIFLTLLRRPVLLIGHEIGPLNRPTLRFIAWLAFRLVRQITVRDDRSLEVLSGLGIEANKILRTADLGWGYNATPKRREPSGGRIEVSLSLMPLQVAANVPAKDTPVDPQRANSEIVFGVASALKKLGKRLRRVSFFVMSGPDRELANLVRPMITSSRFEICDTVDSQYERLRSSNILIGMRMHSIVMAAQMGVRPVGIVVFDKVRELMNELGLSSYTVDAVPLDVNRLYSLIRESLGNQSIGAHLKKTATTFASRAKLNILAVRAVADRY